MTTSVDRQLVEFQEAVNSSAKENGTESGTELSAEIGDPDTLPVNINTASKEQLMTLPKIGPVTAERIIRYREDFGNFTDLDELKNVKGIGPKTFEQLRALITL
ncbi:MAG: helix-hairpin-helix domain-containing protein [Candidatus Neomarinimicrobiota bacterium]